MTHVKVGDVSIADKHALVLLSANNDMPKVGAVGPLGTSTGMPALHARPAAFFLSFLLFFFFFFFFFPLLSFS